MALVANQIWQCLDLDLLDGAEILAEQFVANDNNENTRYLLATVQFRRGLYETAKLTAKHYLESPGCIWIFAHSCLKLNQFEEGIQVLESSRELWDFANDQPLYSPLSRYELSPAAFKLLLAKLYDAEGDKKLARNEFSSSSQLNPFLVENVLALARYKAPDFEKQSPFHGFGDPFKDSHIPVTESVEDTSVPVVHPTTVTSTPRKPDTPKRSGFNTPIFPHSLGTQPAAPSGNQVHPAQQSQLLFSPTSATPQERSSVFLPATGNQLFQTPSNHNLPSLHFGPKTANKKPGERIFSHSFRRQEQSSLSSLGKNIFDNYSHNNLVNVLANNTVGNICGDVQDTRALEHIVEAVYRFAQSNYEEAKNMIYALSPSIQTTPFVLSLLARTHLELGNYQKSAKIYEEIRALQPDRARDMEYYSTTLWHLKKSDKAYALGIVLTSPKSTLRRKWQSWCALGNAFSINGDTQNALKCFNKAVQLNESSSYAYTLLGYEYMANEDFQKALDAFGSAISCDPSRYNAWYGLGSAHYSLGDPEKAENYINEALRLNPNNVVLLSFIGAIYQSKGNLKVAAQFLDRANQLNPNSIMVKYRRADISREAKLYNEAIEDLQAATLIDPLDSDVQFSLGRLYLEIGDKNNAFKHLTAASANNNKYYEELKALNYQ